MTSHAQVSRLLALVPYLQSHPGARLDDTASLFGVTPGQLRKDLDILYMCGLPGLMPGDMIEVDMEAVDGEGVIHVSNADYLTRPVRLTADEAASLVLALLAVRDMADSTTSVAVDSALAKLQAALGERALDAGTVAVATGTVDVRDRLAAALAAGRRVRLVYDGVRETTSPLVDPVRVFVRDGVAYLQAFSLERDDWRSYRLERIADVEPQDTPVEERPAPPVTDTPWSFAREGAGEVTLRLARDAAWVAEYYPVRRTRSTGDGLTVTMGVADPAWLTALLLRLGPGVAAVEPTAAVADARAAAALALERYAVLDAGRAG